MPKTSEKETESYTCPECGSLRKDLKSLKAHLRMAHGANPARDPQSRAKMYAPEHTEKRSARLREACQQRWNDPALAEQMAERLRSLRPMDNAETRLKMATTQSARMTAQWQQDDWASQQRLRLQTPAHRENSAKGGHATASFWRSPEGRQMASERAIQMWADPARREAQSAQRKAFLRQNPAAALRFISAGHNAGRPTSLERVVIEATQGMAVTYTGDGARWFTTKEGRHLNPDFTATGRRVILVDGAYWHPPAQVSSETAAYESMGFRVLRLSEQQVKTLGMQWIRETVATFIGSP
jgi:uncharacterized C2H2 Zn-finger protein